MKKQCNYQPFLLAEHPIGVKLYLKLHCNKYGYL